MKRITKWEKGQSFVEMAFGSVILILLIGGLIDLGRAFLILVAVENAAGEGALFGASNPTCLTDDYNPTEFCMGYENVEDRVREEGKPIINLTDSNSKIAVAVDGQPLADGPEIGKGKKLAVSVEYTYSPVTPIGFMVWGAEARVKATAQQEILAPPPPGYNF